VLDPFEAFNRKSFNVSINLDTALVGPFARVSVGLIPRPLQRAILNIIVNLSEPQVMLNCLLQGRPQGVVKAVTRFAVNSTIGLGGAVDVARAAGLPYEPNGFGDTLGRYHVGPGPYLFIPLMGPSNLRDLAGSLVDQISTPLYFVRYPYRTPVEVSLGTVFGLDERAQDGPKLQALLQTAADPYATVRSAYTQARDAQIRGGISLPPLPDMDEPGADAGAAAAPPTPQAGVAADAPKAGAPPSTPEPGPGTQASSPQPAGSAEPAPPPPPATPPGPESPPRDHAPA
jgi:phospholipid-binding lipoprotein MlaA